MPRTDSVDMALPLAVEAARADPADHTRPQILPVVEEEEESEAWRENEGEEPGSAILPVPPRQPRTMWEGRRRPARAIE